MYVARHQITAADGDLELAREYLERVAASNSEEVGQATELLKKVKGMIVAKVQVVEAGPQTKAAAGPSQPTMTDATNHGPLMRPE
jgi:anaphase-promoting complex subunit 8